MNPKREYKENNGESKGEEIILKKKKKKLNVYTKLQTQITV